MVNYSKRLQLLWHDYEKSIDRPGTLGDAIDWGLENGRISLPELDPRSVLVRQLKSALRNETRTDANGRTYRANAAITFTNEGGVQESLWGDVDSPHTPHEFVVEHFGQRRKQIVDDCCKLKADVDHYNEVHRDREPIQLVLDFSDDVAERIAVLDIREAAE